MHPFPIARAVAPPERLAAFRILVGSYSLGYFALRLPVFLQLRDRDAGFDGAGLFRFIGGPFAADLLLVLIVATLASGVAFTVGTQFRLSGPAFALGALVLTSYRSSWGQLLHFENLMVLHLLIIAFAPAADVWSVDARLGKREDGAPTSYGFPLALAALTTVITYFIAGIAKLRYGGLDWITGDTLRNHIAYSAARLDVLGGDPSPLAGVVVEHAELLPVLAATAMLVELSAPLTLFLRPLHRAFWVGAVWAMHTGIAAIMLIVFGYPLFLTAFAPLFEIEKVERLLGPFRKRGWRAPILT